MITSLKEFLKESLDSDSTKAINTILKTYLGNSLELHNKIHEIIETDCFLGMKNKKKTVFAKFILKNDAGKELDDLRYDILNDTWILKGHDIYEIEMPKKSFKWLEKVSKKLCKEWSNLEELENPLDSSLDEKAFNIK